MPLVPQAPHPRFVVTTDGVRLATYDVGEADAPIVLAVHGFGSSAQMNWFATGWSRELLRSGRRVLAFDQRGHGLSDKPRTPGAYSMPRLVQDVGVVLDAYDIGTADLLGYSLGARVGWQVMLSAPDRVRRGILGGIPDGRPLRRFQLDQADAFLEHGSPIEDRLTRTYLEIAARSPHNDLHALVALVRGLQAGLQPEPDRPPEQPVLFATGEADGILEASRALAASTPRGEFFMIPQRNHFNAPTSPAFRERATAFLDEPLATGQAAPAVAEPALPDREVTVWDAGLAAMRLLVDEQVEVTQEDLAKLLVMQWPRWLDALERVRG